MELWNFIFELLQILMKNIMALIDILFGKKYLFKGNSIFIVDIEKVYACHQDSFRN